MNDNGLSQHKDLFLRTIEKRIPVEFSEAGLKIEIDYNGAIGKEEGYLIEKTNDGWKITGADQRGLYYGIGKFLHTAKWSEKDFVPNPPVGVQAPAHDFRAVYTSVHFHNWYYQASTEELKDYLEELLLWGHNIIISIVPIVCFDSCDEPAFFETVEKNRQLFALAKSLGMKVGIIINPNQGLKTTPAEFAADKSCYEHRGGAGGKNICPSIPGAMEYMRYLWVMVLKRFTDIGLDYVMTWPYDEGGCGCENCRPWGAKAFCDLSTETFKEVKRFYPDAKLILSTWYMDEPEDEGEYAGLWERLKGDMSYIDYLMVDSHEEFPKYPLEHEKLKPMVNFPEISMWGLFSWGGRGANPLLKRFQRIWNESKHLLSGGMPYSEGMFEDLSKVQWIGYYWEPDKNYRDIMWEYISFEISDAVVDEMIEMMELIEENHVRVQNEMEPLLDVAERADELAEFIDAKLNEKAKNAWRWRILYIRAKIDNIIYKKHAEEYAGTENALYELKKTREWYLRDSELVQELMQELCRYYHSVDLFQWNKWTFPPVKDGKVLK